MKLRWLQEFEFRQRQKEERRREAEKQRGTFQYRYAFLKEPWYDSPAQGTPCDIRHALDSEYMGVVGEIDNPDSLYFESIRRDAEKLAEKPWIRWKPKKTYHFGDKQI